MPHRTGLASPSGPIEAGQATEFCSTDFLEWAFRTDSYELEITFNPDGSFSYLSTTMLQVRGRAEPFKHLDRNRLTKVGEPNPNPLLQIRRNGAPRDVTHGFV